MAQLVTTPTSAFPDEEVDPKEKVKEWWLRQYAQAAWRSASLNSAAGTIGYPSRIRYEEEREYAESRQSVARYKKWLGIDADCRDGEEEIITPNSIIPYIASTRNKVLGIVEKQPYKLLVDTIDPDASVELLDTQNARRFRMLGRQQFSLMGQPEMQQHPILAKQPGDADDEEGLGVMAMGERHAICADAQDALRAVHNQNMHEVVRKQWQADLFDHGAAVTKDDTEASGITERNCDLPNVILSYCYYSDFRDLIYAGEVRAIPISQLAAMSCNEISKTDIEMLYNSGSKLSAAGAWFSGWDNTGGFAGFYGQARAVVLDLEILSNDTYEREESKDKYGNMRYGNATKDKEKRKKKEANGSKFTKVTTQNVYRVKWIVGTDIVFDCGKQVNVKRDDKNPAKAKLSYHVTGCNVKRMRTYSRVRALMNVADQLQIIQYRWRKAFNRVKGTTYNVDIDGLDDVDIGPGGDVLSKIELIDFWIKNDILPFRSTGGGLNPNSARTAPPITAMPGTLAQDFAEFRNMTLEQYELGDKILGINALTDGSTPNPKLLNGVANLAAQGTNNALSDLYFADMIMARSLDMSLLMRIQDMCKDGRGDEVAAWIGQTSMRRLATAPALDAYHLAITVEDAPTPEEEQMFTNSLMAAVQAGQITVDEQFMAQSLRRNNLRQAELYLSYRVRKNKDEQKAHDQQQIAMNAQAQQQSAQASEQAKQGTIQMQADLDLRNAIAIEKEKQNTQRIIGEYKLEDGRIGASGRVEASLVQGRAKDETNIRDNQTKLITDGKEGNDQINIKADLENSRVEPSTSETQPNLQIPKFSFLSPVDRTSMAQQASQQQSQQAQMQQQMIPEEGTEQAPEQQPEMQQPMPTQ